MKTFQSKETRDANKNSTPTTASAKTGEVSESYHNLQSQRQNYNIPVKFYNPARKSGSSTAASFIDPIYSQPQLPLARLTDPSSPHYSEAITLDAHQSSSQVGIGDSKGALGIYWQKNIESETLESLSGDIEDANEASPPSPFILSDIQHEEDKPDENAQVGHVIAVNSLTNVIAKDEKGKFVARFL